MFRSCLVKGYKFALSLIAAAMSNGRMAQMIPGEEGGKIRGKTGEKIEDRERERERNGLRGNSCGNAFSFLIYPKNYASRTYN